MQGTCGYNGMEILSIVVSTWRQREIVYYKCMNNRLTCKAGAYGTVTMRSTSLASRDILSAIFARLCSVINMTYVDLFDSECKAVASCGIMDENCKQKVPRVWLLVAPSTIRK